MTIFDLIIMMFFLSVNVNYFECDDLSEGVFEVFEKGEKIGMIHRKGSFQIEYYDDGSVNFVKMKRQECLYYFNSYEIKDDLDTLTWAVFYKKIHNDRYSFKAKPKYLKLDYEYFGEIKKIGNVSDQKTLKLLDSLAGSVQNN